MSAYDLVIRDGIIIDGTGDEPSHGDVAVNDGYIVDVGDVEGKGAREISADGAWVAPGFVDIHTHYDGQLTWDKSLAPSSWHGVTTVVTGNCGVGFAPVRTDDRQRLIELMEGVEDIPGAALHEGLPWTWESFPEYMDATAKLPHDINYGLQLAHGPLRLYVMGERGAQRERATAADIRKMRQIAAEAIAAGALGFTTSRTMNHRTSTGDLAPTLDASTEELVGIAAGLRDAGTGVLQVVSDFADPASEFATLRAMAQESGRPLSISLAQNPNAPHAWEEVLDLVDEANGDGLRVRAQVATRGIGLLLGLQCTLNPFMMNPVYQEIEELPIPERARQMRDPSFKERLLDAATDDRERTKLGGRLIGKFHLMYELGDPPDYEPSAAESIEARAATMGCRAEELAYDLLVKGDGSGFLYLPLLNYADGNLDVVRKMLVHPHTVPGLSDGGAHVGTICDGSFPTTLLGYWGLDRNHNRIPIPFIVKRHCRDTAETVGLFDRGLVQAGYRADLNVIDPHALRLHEPEMHFDLPAGGKRLLQRSSGYKCTIVNGEVAYLDGESTGAMPGKLVRGGQAAPTHL